VCLPALTEAQQVVKCAGPLSEVQFFELVNSSVPVARIADLVKSCGIDFEPTGEVISRLRFFAIPEAVLEAVRTAIGPAERKRQAEQALWESIKDRRDPAAFEDYLRRYPEGQFAAPARQKFRELKIVGVRGRVEQALGDGRWDEAEGLIRELLPVGPEDVAVTGWQRQIVEGREKLRLEKEEAAKVAIHLAIVTGDRGVQSGPIATNAQELAALKRLGERNYIDIDLTKEDKGKRFADITLTLKSVDVKKHMYTVDVMADDTITAKKDKSLNEPVQFYTAKGGHIPYELVINSVRLNEIVGYLATPNERTPNPPAPAQSIQPSAGPRKDQLNDVITGLKSVTGDLGVVSGLVATNGRELAALRLRGGRDYLDITLRRTEQPVRFGDIALKLDSADSEHNRYSVEIMADDKLVTKNDKTINEAVQFYTSKDGHIPYELVINSVETDKIVGYLATPRERNYLEIKLGKTKQPVRFGDITMKLTYADPKRNEYSVEVMADDMLLLKEHKNINEPVQFLTSKGGHIPYELVINQVTKDGIVGYLSTPKDHAAR
jgi:hypothetical protein